MNPAEAASPADARLRADDTFLTGIQFPELEQALADLQGPEQ
jgi:hypothetical protein